MASTGVNLIAGYVPSDVGHWAAKLEPLPTDAVIRPASVTGTTLWSPWHDEAKEGLKRALLLPDNAHLLRLLAERPDGLVDFRRRAAEDPGNDVDVMALLHEPQSSRRTLLLVDCQAVGATKPSRLRAQYVRALRNARATLSNVSFSDPQPEPVLVVLAAWRPGIGRPDVQHRPGWRDVKVPRPALWGYLPFRHGGEEHVLLGRWIHLDASRWARQIEERTRSWLDGELKTLAPADRLLRQIEFRLDLGQGSALVFWLDRGPFRAQLRVPSPKHRRAMQAEGREDYQVRRIRSLRRAAYGSQWAPTGWTFLGETVDEGSPWLTWQWTQANAPRRIDWVTANAEAERFAITMKMFIAGS